MGQYLDRLKKSECGPEERPKKPKEFLHADFLVFFGTSPRAFENACAVNEGASGAMIMDGGEEALIRAWLAHIGESDPLMIADVIERCRTNSKVRDYFLARTAELPKPTFLDDDRRYCAQCMNRTASGLCLAAARGNITASRDYHPVDHLPRRCEGYLAGPDDQDKRPGWERWPWLAVRSGKAIPRPSKVED